MIDFVIDDEQTKLESIVEINKELKNLLDKITDLEWQDKNADHLWKEYNELKALRDKGETHYVKV
jgi:hypothetical protein